MRRWKDVEDGGESRDVWFRDRGRDEEGEGSLDRIRNENMLDVLMDVEHLETDNTSIMLD